jgi:hypothetical protein
LAYQSVERVEWTSTDPSGSERVCKGVASLENHMVQERAHHVSRLTHPMKPQRVRCKLDEATKKPCSDLLASHQRECDCAWPAWQNGDVSHLEIGDEITTHGECVQPL